MRASSSDRPGPGLPGWVLVLLLLPLGLLQARELVVIRQDATGLEFRLSPDWDVARADSTGRLVLSTLDTMDPSDPVEQVRVALPPGTRATARIVSSRQRPLPGVLGSEMETARRRPGLTVRHEPWRDLNTAVLEFGLFSEPGRMLEELQVRVEYEGMSGPGGPSVCSPLELAQCLVNPEQAVRWAPARGSSRITDLAAWEGQTWVRIPVPEEGLYRITPQDLAALGLNAADYDPATIQLYGHDGQMIPDNPAEARNLRSRMTELPLLREHDGDGSFNGSDRLLFYGRALFGLARDAAGRITQTQHYYDTRNEVWLLLDGISTGRSMGTLGNAMAGTVVDRVVWRTFIDENTTNARNSARDWYGAEFVNRNSRSWSWSVPLGTGSRPVSADYKFSYSTNPSNARDSLHFEVNGEPLGGRGVRPSSQGTVEDELNLNGNALVFSITQLQSTGIPVLLDYIRLSVEALPAFADGVCRFESPQVPGPWSTTIAGFPSDGYLLDVTWPDSVRVTRSAAFRDHVPEDPLTAGNGLQRVYYGVTGSRILAVSGASLEPQPDLLAQANTSAMIVIAPASLADAVQPLVDHRNSFGSTPARLVLLEDVYKQFNAGVADPGAVRNFLKADYESGLPAPMLKSVLLVGNGHYDPLGRITGAWPDLFPAWYKGASMIDEYYGRLLSDNSMDIAVGRLAAWSPAEVATYVDKLIRYESGQDDGAWRNHLLFVGDDEHGEGDVVRGWESDHTQHSEFLIRSMVPASFDVERIYTVEYPTVYNPEIRVNEKPLAEKRLLDGIREGAAIINYIGHGNNTTWCHEYLFNTSKHLALLPANNRPSVYIAATCSWAEIDLPIGLALPQQLLTLPRGGAIGVMAATRNTTSGGNDRFARNLYPALFAAWSDSLAPRITVAEAMRIAKNASISSNDELYLYLGDPSMLPGLPAQGGRITSVRRPDGSETDTLRTLELATIEGATGPFNATGGTTIEAGEAFVVVREAAVPRRYYYDLPPSSGTTVPDSLDYESPGALLFAGKVAFAEGRPLARFIMPADFSGRAAPGDVRMYYMGQGQDGRPADGLIHGDDINFALNPDPPVDGSAPGLRLSFNGPQWREGDMLAPNSSVYIVLQDSSGINLTGEIGHRIELVIDEGTPVDLTPHFVYDQGSYTQGIVQQELPWLENGAHEARVRAFDNFNNPGYAEARFELVPAGSLRLEELVNHPNPVKESTRFTFRLGGLALAPPADVELRVFTTRGRRVFADHLALDGNESLYFTEAWRPLDDRGDPLARGVYLYQLRLKVPSTSFSRVDELGNLVGESVSGGTITANGSLIVD